MKIKRTLRRAIHVTYNRYKDDEIINQARLLYTTIECEEKIRRTRIKPYVFKNHNEKLEMKDGARQ